MTRATCGGKLENAVGNGSIRVMARKRFLPKINQTRRRVVVP